MVDPSVYIVSPIQKWWQPRWLYRRIYRKWARQYEGRLLAMGTIDVGDSKVSIGRVNEDGTITIGGEG